MVSMQKGIALAAILVILAIGQLASALTIVRQDGQGGAQTTIAGAIAAEPDGGSIEIQQFSGPFYEDNLGLSWRSLTSTAGKATIIFSQYNGLGISHGSVSNLILIGTGDHVWQRGLSIYGTVTASNIEIYGFETRGMSLEIPSDSTCSVDHIVIGGVSNSTEGTVAITSTGTITIDHCTFQGNPTIGTGSFANIFIYTNNDGLNPTYTGSNITIKNSIIKGGDRSIGAYWLANLALVHQWNDLYPCWDYIKYNWENNNLALDATEMASVDPMFIDPGNNNYQISPSSPLVGQGEGGSTIGAYTPAGPVTRVIRQDGSGGAYTTIAAALAASSDGDTLSIQQFSGNFSEGTINLSGRILTSNTPTLPTISCTAGTAITVVSGQVQNVNLISGGATTGISITGSATVNNCQLTGFTSRGLSINVPSGQACSVTNTYVCVPTANDSVVAIDNQGGVTLNHCTLLGKTYIGGTFANITINVSSSSWTASNITVQNCIIQGGDRGIGAYYLTNPTFALVHSYNDFFPAWENIKWNNDNGNGTLGTGDIEDIDPFYRNPSLLNYKLSPLSPCVGKGSSGSNIGADITTTANAPAPTYGDTLVGADALGRVLPGYATCGATKTGRFIGIQFEPWMGPGVNYGPYDNTQLMAQYGSYNNIVWPGAGGTWYWWGEPELGYYYSNNQVVIRQHAQMLSDAGVDTIMIDYTNGYTYDSVLTLMAVWQAIRDAGGTTPQVCFFVNNSTTAQTVYNTIYAANKYPNLWFRWGGKPLMMTVNWYGSYSATLRNYFTFRQSWAWSRNGRPYYNGWFTSNTTGRYKWPWLDDYTQNFGWATTSSKAEEVAVCVAQHPNELVYPANGGGIGRSFNTTGYGNGSEPTVGSPGPFSQTPNGVYFDKQWTRALALNWDNNAFIWITGWNEWIAQRQIATDTTHKMFSNAIPNGGTYFVDQFNQEFSRDIEPMKDGHTDNYYYQMMGNIRKFKGVHADPVANAPITITIDGSFSDWNSVTPVYRDFTSDAWQRNTVDWNNLAYNNNTGRNDFTVLKVINDATNVYFYAECLDDITPYTNPNWMWLLVNKDMSWTSGWQGFDYLVNYTPGSSTQTTLKQATTTAWSWNTVSSSISYRVSGNKIEISIPRSSLGIGAGAVEFYFKWADNVQNPGNVIDFSTYGDSAPNRRLAYHYKSNS